MMFKFHAAMPWLWLVCFGLFSAILSEHSGSCQLSTEPMAEEERLSLKEEAREMFYHGYNAYMANAYPADELLPLSCAGRYRDLHTSRGDIDDVLGNFSLTLVDSLDTLVLLGDLPEFERAVKLIIRDVNFDTDVIVSVFETNIRMLGGLLSGHVLAEHLIQVYGIMPWYTGELLVLAHDVATRLLPAFNTSTGIPHPRVNLRHGMNSPMLVHSRDTCTSCAGTMILEFASLSRLTGHPVFEEKARQTMDYLWQQRHRGSDLVGTVLNVHSGDWVRRDSGVGAGIDSYYEYLLKAHVLLGDHQYLHRFNKHYSAVMKYINQGPIFVDVHMHRPHTASRNFMDAFLAFWPGLQVLKGDIKPAIETHEMLYQVIQRHNFLPEAFTTDFQVHWGQHPLRPEFVESTYLLYEATSDPYYLRVGRDIMRTLQRHAWVPCGYAALKDVRTGGHEDRMDSFVLSETFKYLYLLFSLPNELPINLDNFVFTTEAHLLPLSLATMTNLSTPAVPLLDSEDSPAGDADVFYRSCPNAHSLFPGQQQYAENIRNSLKNFVEGACPSRSRGPVTRKLKAIDFMSNNEDHLQLLKDMGITIFLQPSGRLQLLQATSSAVSPDDAAEGLLFMEEMIELSRVEQQGPDHPPKSVVYELPSKDGGVITLKTLSAGPAQFGVQLVDQVMVEGELVKAQPINACEKLHNSDQVKGKIVLLMRGGCMFIDKARVIQSAGAIGGVVIDNSPPPIPNPNEGGKGPPLFAMSGDNSVDDVAIPMVFLFSPEGKELTEALEAAGGKLNVLLADLQTKDGRKKNDNTQYVLTEEQPLHKRSAVRAILTNRGKDHGVKGEGSCSDDLVTLVEEGSKGRAVPTKLSSGGAAGEVLLAGESFVLAATSADEAVEALQRYVQYSRREGRRPQGRWLLSRLQELLTLKGVRSPHLLRALLSSHLPQLIKLLEDSLTTVAFDTEDAQPLDSDALVAKQDISSQGADSEHTNGDNGRNNNEGNDNNETEDVKGESRENRPQDEKRDTRPQDEKRDTRPQDDASDTSGALDKPHLIDGVVHALLEVLVISSSRGAAPGHVVDIGGIGAVVTGSAGASETSSSGSGSGGAAGEGEVLLKAAQSEAASAPPSSSAPSSPPLPPPPPPTPTAASPPSTSPSYPGPSKDTRPHKEEL